MRIAKCVECQKELSFDKVDGEIKWFDPTSHEMLEKTKKGIVGYGYICTDCRKHHEDEDTYEEKNEKRKGTAKAMPYTYGIELETSLCSPESHSFLNSLEWIATHDCTVECEYKSPIMEGLASLSKTLKTLDRMSEKGLIDTTDGVNGHRQVGTHCNIGLRGVYDWNHGEMLRQYYNTIFYPLSLLLESDPENCKKIFGRKLAGWASPITMNTDPYRHANFINVTKKDCIEFRMCKYHTGHGKEYMDTVKVCRKLATILFKASDELLHTDFDDEQKRIDIAEKCARKLVATYGKIAGIC